MKISLDISPLNDPQRTGIGVYEYELLKVLLKEDKTDTFTLFGFATVKNFAFLKSLFPEEINIKVILYKFPSKLFRTLFIFWQKIKFPFVEQLIGTVDVVHNFNWYFPPTLRAKKVATVYDMTSLLYPKWHDEKTIQLDTLRFNAIKKNADMVIAISEQTKKDFLNFSPKSRVEVIYPGVSKIFTPKKNKKLNEKIMKKYKIEKGYILSVSTLEPRKNLESLVKAFINIPTHAKLVLVGKSGWKNEKLESLIKNNKDRIQTLEYVPEKDLPSIYQEALVFIYPSFYEGFGIPILEAMSCGTPVIISNTSSMPEVGGDAAIYINPKSILSIQKALKEVINSPKLLEKYRKKVLIQSKKFSWEKSAKKLIQNYHSL